MATVLHGCYSAPTPRVPYYNIAASQRGKLFLYVAGPQFTQRDEALSVEASYGYAVAWRAEVERLRSLDSKSS